MTTIFKFNPIQFSITRIIMMMIIIIIIPIIIIIIIIKDRFKEGFF